jgi:cellobiose phosphorylase
MNNNTNHEIEYDNHRQLIRDMLDEIAPIAIAQNPKNTGPMRDQIVQYKQIIKIAQDKINSLNNNIRLISRSNGGKRRKTRKTRSG